MNNHPQVEGFLSQYDDLAIAVIDDQRPNTHADMEMSNAEMAAEACNIMEWEEFDLLYQFPFEEIYNTGSVSQILAYFYVAHLRPDLFNSAAIQDIGDREFNRHARAFSEYWYMKLRDKYDALVADAPVKHIWMN